LAPRLFEDAGLFVSSRPARGSHQEDASMAKGQKRSNREIRKPKSTKAPAAASISPLQAMSKGTQATPNKTKKT
jgi:hypothetical protein